MTCTHCTHPLYAAIRCSVCGRWSNKLTPEEIAELRQGKKAIAEYVQNNFQKEEKMHRIDELIQQATMVFEPDDPDYRHETFLPRKFAELIVRECAPFVGDLDSTAVKELFNHFGIET